MLGKKIHSFYRNDTISYEEDSEMAAKKLACGIKCYRISKNIGIFLDFLIIYEMDNIKDKYFSIVSVLILNSAFCICVGNFHKELPTFMYTWPRIHPGIAVSVIHGLCVNNLHIECAFSVPLRFLLSR